MKAMATTGIEQLRLFLLYQCVVLSDIDFGLGFTNPVTVQPAEARQGAKWSHESHSGGNKRNSYSGHVMRANPAVGGNWTRAGANQSMHQRGVES